MSKEAMKLALEALEYIEHNYMSLPASAEKAITALKQALEQPEPEPVAWAISHDGETPYTLWDGGDCALLDIEVERHGGKTRKMPLYTSPPKHEPEPVAWRDAALRVGEDLCSVGPFGYYDMTAEQWLDWALSVVTVHAPPPKREPPCKTGSQCITKCMECTKQEPVIDKSAAIRIATSLGWTPPRKPLTQDLNAPLTLNGIALYPRQQPLTDEEIDLIGKRMFGAGQAVNTDRDFARAIEAAHGIKEET